jgi:hypothetical protein
MWLSSYTARTTEAYAFNRLSVPGVEGGLSMVSSNILFRQ